MTDDQRNQPTNDAIPETSRGATLWPSRWLRAWLRRYSRQRRGP